MKRYIYILSLIVAVLLFVSGCGQNRHDNFTEESSSEDSASIYPNASELPVIVKWVNCAPHTETGGIAPDQWAMDRSGISNGGYVLINQDGLEELRVKNYPEDISAGEVFTAPKYECTFTLSVPEEIINYVFITFESPAAENTLTFMPESNYTATADFYAGTYEVTFIETPGADKTYKLRGDTSLSVIDSDGSFNLELAEEKETPSTGTPNQSVTNTTANAKPTVVQSANLDTGISWDGVSKIVYTYPDGTTGTEKKVGATYEKEPGVRYTVEASDVETAHSEYDGTCSHCGKVEGDGTGGTCVRWLMGAVDCPNCGEHVEPRTCHTCGQ